MGCKAVSFVAWSGTGKTTLMEKVIRELKNRGYRVGAIKCDSHGFNMDQPGKDSYRMTAAGADTVVLASGERLAMVKKYSSQPAVEDIIDDYFVDVDVVLVEGFKRSGLPKIEIHRKELGKGLICRGSAYDSYLIAVASNEKLQLDVPLYDIDDVTGITDLIEGRILRKV